MILKTQIRVRTPFKIILGGGVEVEVEVEVEAGEKEKVIFPTNPDLNPMTLSIVEGNRNKDLKTDPKAIREEIQITKEKISFPILMEEQENSTIIPIQIKIQITEITSKEITLLNQREDHIHNHRKKEFPLKNQRKEF